MTGFPFLFIQVRWYIFVVFKIYINLFFPGIKRPPALLCTDDYATNLQDYEICLIEPLHDIKNVINRLFGELPHGIQEQRLREAITKAKLDLKGWHQH